MKTNVKNWESGLENSLMRVYFAVRGRAAFGCDSNLLFKAFSIVVKVMPITAKHLVKSNFYGKKAVMAEGLCPRNRLFVCMAFQALG